MRKDKMVKEMTREEYQAYHYLPYREKRLTYQKEYYKKHKEEIKKKARARYRAKVLGESNKE